MQSPMIAMPLLQSRLLSEIPGVRHGITRRQVGLGLADGNVGFSAPRDRIDAWAMRQFWCEQIGVDADRLVTLSQVHGNCVIRVGSRDSGRGARPDTSPVGRGDALITNEPGIVLLTLHADCTPVLIVDPIGQAVASIHAGWRGTVADVPGATVRAMSEAFGSRPEDLRVFVGPGIGSCCYDVGDDVVTAWRRRVGSSGEQAIITSAGRMVFDVPVAISLLLDRAGVRSDQIELSGICTRCNCDDWFSHRGQGATTGRFGAMIALTTGEENDGVPIVAD